MTNRLPKTVEEAFSEYIHNRKNLPGDVKLDDWVDVNNQDLGKVRKYLFDFNENMEIWVLEQGKAFGGSIPILQGNPSGWKKYEMNLKRSHDDV